MADHPEEPVTHPPIRAEVAGNRLEVIETGEGRLRALLELIAGAQHNFKMLMYMFNPDHAGGVVHDALLGAARRGVAVRSWSTASGPTCRRNSSTTSPRRAVSIACSIRPTGGVICFVTTRSW